MRRLTILGLAAAAAGASPAFAANPNLLACQHSGTQTYECSVASATAQVVGALPFEMDVDLTYAFVCTGNRPPLAFEDQATRSRAPVAFTAAGGATVHLTGNGPVRLVDDDPDATYLATLIGACKLEVTATRTAPSFNTLTHWQTDAHDATVAIDDAVDAWELARSLDRIMEFDADEMRKIAASLKDTVTGMLAEVDLTWAQVTDPATGRFKPAEAMPPAWGDLAALHPDLADLTILYDYARDVLAARPPVHTPAEVEEAAADAEQGVAARYLAKLKRKMRDGQGLVDRGNQYLTQLSGDMKALSDRIAALRQTYPVLR